MSPIVQAHSVSPIDIRAILRQRRSLILTVFIVIVATVMIGTLAMPNQYETRMKVLVKNERADVIVSPDRNGGSGYRSEVSEAQINSEIELLTSKNLLERV